MSTRELQKLSQKKKKAVIKVLNLGCNQRAAAGESRKIQVTNVDVVAHEGVDEVVDLNVIPWPWPENTFDRVVAYDLIEHLQSPIDTMNEICRVMRPGGQADILVPSTDGRGAWQDPTHVYNPFTQKTGSYWNENSFLYYAMIPERPEDEESDWISHPWRSLYPESITACFAVGVQTKEPTPEHIVYCHALLTKLVPDENGRVNVEQITRGVSQRDSD